ncbi:phosphotransferase [Neobacillus vireti]|uniref:Aminoglycoside phosphotransferase n=1 Tax=Neobacillus vireti LMG 21834 TaxID=1131730 RepID=A0AB94IN97_9BACI|nr:phosphotransferase [Neobacillus vireti]ETI68499.1 aminoglycoside phosphotransferase [Neobacillus vireti LMG 21834]KLT15366.1 hypothetical protein AA980_24720 [Neobacillus vireti]
MHIKSLELEKLLKRIFNKEQKVLTVKQLHGGAQKVVYKVACLDGFTCILYVWDWSKNYVLGRAKNEKAKPIGQSYGAELFEYNFKYLQQLGIRVPNVYYIDRTQSSYSFDFAIVEDVGNIDLSAYIQANPELKPFVLKKLENMLKRIHKHSSEKYGQLNLVDRIEKQSLTCEQIVLNETLKDLDHLVGNVPSIAENKDRLTKVLYKLYGDLSPRRKYGLIHGELGPDHVRVDPEGNPILIDIEGCKFFDIEYEHAFLEFRFGEHYRYIRNDELDPNRMLFYKFHLHISYSSGPIKIIEGGFPDADFIRDIVDYNVKATLGFLNNEN